MDQRSPLFAALVAAAVGIFLASCDNAAPQPTRSARALARTESAAGVSRPPRPTALDAIADADLVVAGGLEGYIQGCGCGAEPQNLRGLAALPGTAGEGAVFLSTGDFLSRAAVT